MTIPEQNGTAYCKTTDVADYFRQVGDDFPSETEIGNYEPGTGSGTAQNPSGIHPPSKEEVERIILRKTDAIDRATGHAWRERKVVNEMRDIDGPYYWNSGVPVPLRHREIVTPLDSAKGDKIEVWEGENYNDWVSNPDYTEGRDGDYWVHVEAGILYIYRRPLYINRLNLRVSYRYGSDAQYGVPRDVEEATAKMTAAELIRSDLYGQLVPGSDGGLDPNSIADRYDEQAQQILAHRTELRNPL